MRWVVVTLLAAALAFGGGSAALAKKVPCKKIKQAMASGKTAEEVATELETRVQRVHACMSGKKKKEAGAPAAAADSADEDDAEAED